jgi:hypothetical protein
VIRFSAAIVLVFVAGLAPADSMQYRGIEWSRLHAYRDVPADWMPRIVEQVVNAEYVICGKLRALGCAHVPHDPYAGLPCRVRLAWRASMHPDEVRRVAEHERMHCFGWMH